MKIESVQFVMSAATAPAFSGKARAEIAMSGRSNVGKSSLLNSLLGRKRLAHVSNTPGKTQHLNYFLVNDRFHLVDLPGYGYARAPVPVRRQWSRMMQGYLRNREELVGIVQLVDVRHPPSPEDREMVQWLLDEQMPFCLVATKIDKIGSSKVPVALRDISRALKLPQAQIVVPYSSETGDGRTALLGWIGHTLDAVSA